MNWLVKNNESYNGYYGTYTAAWCRKSGLPMHSYSSFHKIKDELYTISRAKKEKVLIDTTRVAGWYRVYNGYVPLFRRKGVNGNEYR